MQTIITGVLYLFWHRNILPLLYLRRGEGVGVMISSSKDGDYVAEPAKVLGFKPIRGSITRGGAKAAREMIRFARDNSICIVPDGPKGPACKIKSGAGIISLLIRTSDCTCKQFISTENGCLIPGISFVYPSLLPRFM